jgi:uncharacterized repeat protein (TIGR03803 family)
VKKMIESNVRERTIQACRKAGWAACILASLQFASIAPADYRVLHHFAGGVDDGAGPLGSLIRSGSTLYGMTRIGGAYGNGTIFKVSLDGAGFQRMHSFVSASTEGQRPYGALLPVGSVLYGMAASENTSYGGVLFRIGLDGTDFQVIHRFAGAPSDGRWPYDSLILSGSTLYGMTVSGGNGDNTAGGGSSWGGTVFKINLDGTGYQILHHFAGGSADGMWSAGNLTLLGTSLYGITFRGGGSNQGTIFRLNVDGTGFTLLRSFTAGANDGSGSHGSLVQSGSAFYGMSGNGGGSNLGTIFRINTDGAGFSLLHSFAGGNNDGSGPGNSLVQSGSALYGMTGAGGPGDRGTVFQIRCGGVGFRLLHTFAGGVNDGASPSPGPPLLSDSTLYGMTTSGGRSGQGVIFAMDLPQPKLVPDQYSTIQEAIDAAQAGDVIQVAPGIYRESLAIIDKDTVVQSVTPDDPDVTGRTVVVGDGQAPVVSLQNTTAQCVLGGFTIRGGAAGVWCVGGRPSIYGCRIVENVGSGLELLNGAEPAIDHCIIAANGGFGVELVAPQKRSTFPKLTNCTITQNAEGGVSGMVVLRNSILYFNGEQGASQITSQGQQVTYSYVQGGFTGQGNTQLDPLFVSLGRWTDANDVNYVPPAWTGADYHLQSSAGCWDPCSAAWVRDKRTSPCVDGGNPGDAVGAEPSPNGGRINMGAYGGTTQASKSPSLQFTETGQQLNRFIGRGVALADLNSDGALDAFVTNEEGYRIYLGDSKGLFTDSGQRLPQAADGYGKAALFDVNGDGRIDAVTGSTAWLNDGSGRFASQPLSIESSETVNLGPIRIADLNADSHVDIFALRSYAASRVYLNDGSGRFRDSGQRLGDGTIGTGQLAFIVLGDIDGNGTIDAVTGGWRWNGSTQCPNHVWLNDGQGTFRDSGQLLDEGGSHVHGLALADLTGDERLELIMGIQDANRSGRIYINDGSGRFIGGPNLGGAGGENVAIDDFDGDGTLDVFVAHSTPPSRVWLNNGDGTLRDSGARLGNNTTWDVAAGDFNTDGRPDAFTVGCFWGTGLSPAPAQIWLNAASTLPPVRSAPSPAGTN